MRTHAQAETIDKKREGHKPKDAFGPPRQRGALQQAAGRYFFLAAGFFAAAFLATGFLAAAFLAGALALGAAFFTVFFTAGFFAVFAAFFTVAISSSSSWNEASNRWKSVVFARLLVVFIVTITYYMLGCKLFFNIAGNAPI
jgi:hypothetical protein